MKEFQFTVIQDAKCFYTGTITIKASNKKEAISKIKQLTDEEIDELVDEWELDDNVSADGNGIEIMDEKGNIIK